MKFKPAMYVNEYKKNVLASPNVNGLFKLY